MNTDDRYRAANEEARTRILIGILGKGAHLSYEDAVADFPEQLINKKPDHVPYTFWHQLEHIRIAQWDLWRYMAEANHTSPDWPRGYWPGQDEMTDLAGFQRSIDRYISDRVALIEWLKSPELDLLAPVAHTKNQSILRSAQLIVDHTAYHLGEFVMGRQILGAWRSAL